MLDVILYRLRRTRGCFLLASLVLGPSLARAQAHQLVDIGPYSLDVVRAGRGAPAVILEAGLGDSLNDWATIWPAVAKLTTVVAYSRISAGPAGGPTDYGARQAVEDLHALLGKLRIAPPYILVGRSYGGLLVRLYTSVYPADVRGLVIVDGTHEQQVQRWGALDSTYPAAFRAFFDSLVHTMPPGAQAGEIRETMRIQAAGAVEGMQPLPDIPIAVLTSMKVDPAATTINMTARGHAAWRAMHDEWFRRSTNGLHIETTKAGHAIQRDEPQLVIDAIQFVLARVRVQ
jgi:pimeloyl-ACP methyl ester carboxylesterase